MVEKIFLWCRRSRSNFFVRHEASQILCLAFALFLSTTSAQALPALPESGQQCSINATVDIIAQRCYQNKTETFNGRIECVTGELKSVMTNLSNVLPTICLLHQLLSLKGVISDMHWIEHELAPIIYDMVLQRESLLHPEKVGTMELLTNVSRMVTRDYCSAVGTYGCFHQVAIIYLDAVAQTFCDTTDEGVCVTIIEAMELLCSDLPRHDVGTCQHSIGHALANLFSVSEAVDMCDDMDCVDGAIMQYMMDEIHHQVANVTTWSSTICYENNWPDDQRDAIMQRCFETLGNVMMLLTGNKTLTNAVCEESVADSNDEFLSRCADGLFSAEVFLANLKRKIKRCALFVDQTFTFPQCEGNGENEQDGQQQDGQHAEQDEVGENQGSDSLEESDAETESTGVWEYQESCIDLDPQWVDRDGESCAIYESHPSWCNPQIASLASDASGNDAMGMCCACGGGFVSQHRIKVHPVTDQVDPEGVSYVMDEDDESTSSVPYETDDNNSSVPHATGTEKVSHISTPAQKTSTEDAGFKQHDLVASPKSSSISEDIFMYVILGVGSVIIIGVIIYQLQKCCSAYRHYQGVGVTDGDDGDGDGEVEVESQSGDLDEVAETEMETLHLQQVGN